MVHVSNIGDSVTEAMLRQFLNRFGDIQSVTLDLDETGKCKGTGLVTFKDAQDAQRAILEGGKKLFSGKKLTLRQLTSDEVKALAPPATDPVASILALVQHM